jgi:hypothetical protein
MKKTCLAIPGRGLEGDMETLSRVTWLFVRGDDTIRVKLSSSGLTVAVSGPRYEARLFRFADTATSDEFLRLYEQHLISDGWGLQGFVERRSTHGTAAFPKGLDRRRSIEVTH